MFHDHVNCDRAPIDRHEVDGSSQVFDRIITGFGAFASPTGGLRTGQITRERPPGKRLSTSITARAEVAPSATEQAVGVRSDWRRSEGEGVGSLETVSAPITFEWDSILSCSIFVARSKGCGGGSTLPHQSPRVPAGKARMFAEVLDSIVKSYGRHNIRQNFLPLVYIAGMILSPLGWCFWSIAKLR